MKWEAFKDETGQQNKHNGNLTNPSPHWPAVGLSCPSQVPAPPATSLAPPLVQSSPMVWCTPALSWGHVGLPLAFIPKRYCKHYKLVHSWGVFKLLYSTVLQYQALKYVINYSKNALLSQLQYNLRKMKLKTLDTLFNDTLCLRPLQ